MCDSSLMDDYLQASVWSPSPVALVRYRPTLTESSPSVNQLNSDVLQVCLLLEGVSVFAQVGYHLITFRTNNNNNTIR